MSALEGKPREPHDVTLDKMQEELMLVRMPARAPERPRPNPHSTALLVGH